MWLHSHRVTLALSGLGHGVGGRGNVIQESYKRALCVCNILFLKLGSGDIDVHYIILFNLFWRAVREEHLEVKKLIH